LETELVSDLLGPDGSLLTIIYQGDIGSMIVMIILLIISVISWGLIIRKWFQLYRTEKASRKFLKNLRLEEGLEAIHYRSVLYPTTHTSLLFIALYDELGAAARGEKKPLWHSESRLTEDIDRIIDKTVLKEKAVLEKDLSVLATIASSAPFIGLLGTVTGIIDSFYSIAAKGASSIAVVAPGISAALVATALGLFTAIPALIAFNLFRERTRKITNEMIRFGLELTPLFSSEIIRHRLQQKAKVEATKKPRTKPS
jgi:biopolymer transport protein TolQ